jgi:hypothetical protein
VDLSADQTVEVDLSVVNRQIRTLITAPEISWCLQAQEELPVLEQALESLGFYLKDASIDVGKPHPFERLKTSEGPPLMTVDIEI